MEVDSKASIEAAQSVTIYQNILNLGLKATETVKLPVSVLGQCKTLNTVGSRGIEICIQPRKMISNLAARCFAGSDN